VVAVPSRGIDRWIAQELSHRLDPSGHGIAANTRFPTINQLIGSTIAAVGGLEADEDPWGRHRLRWTVLRAVEASLGEPWMRLVHAYLDGGTTRSPRVTAAGRIADLYLAYERDRPEMVRAWATGSDVDGTGAPIGERMGWQPRLWRVVREVAGVPSPAERMPETVAAIAAHPERIDLPDRLAVYGLTRLPRGHLEVLRALGERREVHLLVLHPSPAAWERDAAAPLPDGEARGTGDDAGHPLRVSWGRDASELQATLRIMGFPDAADYDVAEAEPATVLARLQAAVRGDAWPVEPAPIGDGDTSLQVHACPGPIRQAQVLRDALLHVMSADPTIQPRDVVVMCPDVETYAPIVEAVFPRAADGSPLPDLRVRVADRSPRSLNPLAQVATTLLHLAAGRMGAAEVLDLAAAPPVRRALGLDDDHLTEIAAFADEARVRWGLDADHRTAWGLPPVDDNSWRSGLARLLTGVFVPDTDHEPVADTLPVPGIEGSELDPLGRLAELVARLGDARSALSGTHSGPEWHARLMAATGALAGTEWGADWQWDHLARLLADRLPAGDDVALELADVIDALGDLAAGAPTRADHRTGQLTVCTLVPMRSVPHRVIALLGMDDGVFPRTRGRYGDDVLALAPRIGDRDPGSEDRQLLLDALMAAEDHLIVTYSGQDERTNQPLPPAVPVAELLDVVDRTFTAEGGGPARQRIVRQHPLQPFDPRVFEAGDGRSPWGFDAAMLAGAAALTTGRHDPEPFLDAPLPVEPEDPIALDALVRFVETPVRAFVQTRLGFGLFSPAAPPDDLIPVELDPLGEWAVGDRLVRGVGGGVDMDDLVRAERRRGDLPPGPLADEVVDKVRGRAEAVLDRAVGAGVLGGGDAVTVDVVTGDGRRVVGVVGPVHGNRLGVVQYATVAPRHLAAAYVRVVALTAAEPAVAWDAAVVGRGRGDTVAAQVIGPLGGTAEERGRAAGAALELLVDLYDRGMREPLPIYTKTSHAWATAWEGYEERRAQGEWETGGWGWDKEDRDEYHRLVVGEDVPFADLLVERPREDEVGDGWPEEGSRFAVYARRLWEPILAVMGEVE
jgi:exodeoxyribonuclease V gamma subunit